MSEGSQQFGQRIRAARLARGWSQGRLAREIGVSRSTISRIESGETDELLLSNGLKLMQVLGITLASLTQDDLPSEYSLLEGLLVTATPSQEPA
jgi:putative transcriptional regulator